MVNSTAGILIMGSDILALEFFKYIIKEGEWNPMADKNSSNTDDVDECDYQLPYKSCNYQPVIPKALKGKYLIPPIGASGVPPARNHGVAVPTPAVKNSSSD
jgi:hypothetical protein